MVTFSTTIEQTGKTTTGIRLPDHVLADLDAGQRPRVVVVLDGDFTYRTTVGSHDGAAFLSVSSAIREAAGVAGGDEVTVEVTVDTAPREVEVPADLAAALAEHPAAAAWFGQLTDSQRGVFVTSVTSAKQPETRQRRVVKAIEALQAQQKRP
jgi:antitoxin component of MazEF toxin-antitoxin module